MRHYTRIGNTNRAWQGDRATPAYADLPGLSVREPAGDVHTRGDMLIADRWVGAEVPEDDGESYKSSMRGLTTSLREQQADVAKLDTATAVNLRELWYGG